MCPLKRRVLALLLLGNSLFVGVGTAQRMTQSQRTKPYAATDDRAQNVIA